MTVWLGILILFALAGVAAKTLDVWLRPQEKHKVQEQIAQLWYSFGDSDPRIVVQTPLRITARILDRAWGRPKLSFKAFRRCTGISLILFTFALVLYGVRFGNPLSTNDLPWNQFDATFAAVDKFANNPALHKGAKPEAEKALRQFDAYARTYNTPANREAYTIAFLPAVLILAAFFNFICIAFVRQALDEMINCKSLVGLFSLSFTTIIVSLMIYSVGLAAICAYATPISWFWLWLLWVCTIKVSWILGAALLLPSVIFTLFIGATWIKMLAGVIILPGTLVVVISVGTMLLFPIRRQLRYCIVEVLDRALSHSRGFFAFCAVIFAGLGTLVALLPKVLFQWHLPF
jgi:hypothetical protein